MNDRIAFNQIKGIFLIALFLVLILQSILGNAQSLKKKPFYRGLEANFATHSFHVVNNIPEINGHVVTQAGGAFEPYIHDAIAIAVPRNLKVVSYR